MELGGGGPGAQSNLNQRINAGEHGGAAADGRSEASCPSSADKENHNGSTATLPSATTRMRLTRYQCPIERPLARHVRSASLTLCVTLTAPLTAPRCPGLCRCQSMCCCRKLTQCSRRAWMLASHSPRPGPLPGRRISNELLANASRAIVDRGAVEAARLQPEEARRHVGAAGEGSNPSPPRGGALGVQALRHLRRVESRCAA